jgi:hypothetical protein
VPENRLQRTRATLPAGYQFGDARGVLVTERIDWTDPLTGKGYYFRMPFWRHPSENAAERLTASKLADGLLTVPFEPDLGGSVEDAEREALAAMPNTAAIVPMEIPLGCDRAVIRPSGVRVVEQYAPVGTVDDPTPRTIGRVDLAYRLPAHMPPHTQSVDDID